MWRLEFQLHVQRAGNRIRAIGRNLAESNSAVHRDRISHDRLNRVETHAPVADLAGFGDDAVCDNPAQALAAELRAQIKALHLADVWLEFVQRDTPHDFTFILGQKQPPVWRSIVTRKTGKFSIEILEAEAEPKRFCILEK